MKRAVLLAQLSNNAYREDKMIHRYKQLRMPPVPLKPKVPYSGKLPCPEYPFDERFQRIQGLHYSCQREVLSVYRWLHDKWIEKFRFYSFVDSELSSLELPCSLEDFITLQSEKSIHATKQLIVEFRQAFMDQFLDSVQDVYDFFQSNLVVYKGGSLYKLFRVLDLKLSEFMRSMIFRCVLIS